MKRLTLKIVGILASGLFWITFNSNSQEVKLSREEMKEVKKAELSANFHIIDSLLVQKSFVLEADFLQNQYGSRIHVPAALNFIRVDSTNVVLQTGYYSNIGYNGVGGVTAEGRLNRWEISRNLKNLSHYVQFSIVTSIGIYDVALRINSDNYVTATITGLTPGQLVYIGHLETLHNSRVFKGQNTL